MKWKIFQWMKFLFRHSSNSRKLSRQKFHNELAYIFTAHLYARKNASWNQQQLTDGGVLANRNSANHPYCFLSNQKKVQILAFLHVICERNVSCPPPENRLQRWRERAWSQAKISLTLAAVCEWKNCKNKNVCKHYNHHINVGATTETGSEVNVIVSLDI